MANRRTAISLATTEILGLLPISSFVAISTTFIDTWSLTNTEAGWIGGVFYLGYMAAVPFVMGLTDRMDSRRILLLGLAVMAVANIGYAYGASGFWSACLWRIISGLGLSCVYMPGLKALTDRIEGSDKSRYVTFYTANYSVGTSLSFLITGLINDFSGWQDAFIVAGIAPLAGIFIVSSMIGPKTPEAPVTNRSLFDFRPAFRNREAMGYVLAYGAHCCEMMAFRSWITAFLEFILLRAGGASVTATIAIMATGLTFLGVIASISGNELALKYGRRRVLIVLMIISGCLAFVLGFSAGLPIWVPIALCIVYSFVVVMDSGALTSGVVAAAKPGEQGVTMAVHSTVGFATSAMGPLLVGFALDLGGRDNVMGWGFGFMAAGCAALLGPVALALTRKRA